jgi:hypothetical protein
MTKGVLSQSPFYSFNFETLKKPRSVVVIPNIKTREYKPNIKQDFENKKKKLENYRLVGRNIFAPIRLQPIEKNRFNRFIKQNPADKKSISLADDKFLKNNEEKIPIKKDQVILKPIGDYIDNRTEMFNEMVKSLDVSKFLPEFLRTVPFNKIKEKCIAELELMSKNRIRAILRGETNSLLVEKFSPDPKILRPLREKQESLKDDFTEAGFKKLIKKSINICLNPSSLETPKPGIEIQGAGIYEPSYSEYDEPLKELNNFLYPNYDFELEDDFKSLYFEIDEENNIEYIKEHLIDALVLMVKGCKDNEVKDILEGILNEIECNECLTIDDYRILFDKISEFQDDLVS